MVALVGTQQAKTIGTTPHVKIVLFQRGPGKRADRTNLFHYLLMVRHLVCQRPTIQLQALCKKS